MQLIIGRSCIGSFIQKLPNTKVYSLPVFPIYMVLVADV